MDLKDVAIADGAVEMIRSAPNEFVVTFRDWQSAGWEFSFVNVIGVENFGVEGEELDGVVEEHNSDFIDRARRITKEPDTKMKCFAFRSAWSDEPIFRIVASKCHVRKISNSR